ncbi:hypothetical protein QE429_002531 [Bacillus sp. SORGH_AS 510]|uniref:DUF3800 domain-containing protein n=1 Tax=Bacillus sp. SORGH_AS_0510 TaxID=3041771 RepID=UPI002783EB60|nr:DUF3800 domain-containing protein [Bacillus sp. SORGH_AS_0510]MDQ1145704.1 hypothetical protein [Bacillus sp. SORGH_AS_0510]
MDEIQYGFLDEFGDYRFDFDKSDVSTHFIIVAILVKDSNKASLEQEMDRIRQAYVQTEDLTSRSFDNDLTQRMQILNEIKDLPFSIYAYVIDKRKIREDSGIMSKTSYLKYVNKMVYRDLNITFEQLDLVADDRDEKLFLREFKNYIRTKSIPDLFNHSTFGFNNSKSNILLLLADLIAGTLAKGYDLTHQYDQYRSFFKIIKKRIAAINLLPLDYKDFLQDTKSTHQDSRYNDVIIQHSVNLTYQYIEKHRKNEEEEEKLRIDFLKFLLFNLKENPDEYVYTEEILDNLNAIRDLKLNPHNFRSSVVSKLRDSGLLIASSNKGYKLPACLNDLYDFVNLSSLTIHPMIQRISKCRDQILLATNNEIDILGQKGYGYLKKIIELEKLEI